MLKYQSSPRHRDSSLGYFSRFTYSSSIHCSSKQQSAGVPALLGIHRIRCLITHTLHTCCNRLTSSCFSCRTSSASLCSASSCCLRSATSLMCCRTIHRQFKGNVTEIMSYVLPRAMELKHGLYLTEEKVRNSCHKPEQHKENLKKSVMTTLYSPSTQIPAAAFPKSLCSLRKAMSQDPAWQNPQQKHQI